MSLSVLIAHSNRDVGRDLAAQLNADGNTATAADTRQDALSTFADHPVDVLILETQDNEITRITLTQYKVPPVEGSPGGVAQER